MQGARDLFLALLEHDAAVELKATSTAVLARFVYHYILTRLSPVWEMHRMLGHPFGVQQQTKLHARAGHSFQLLLSCVWCWRARISRTVLSLHVLP
jgi:hypothetical protein